MVCRGVVDKSSLGKHRTLRHSVGSPQLDNARIGVLLCASRNRINNQAPRTIARLISGHMPSDGTIGGLVAKLIVLRVECPTCGRQGRYHVARLLEELGPGYSARVSVRPGSKSSGTKRPETGYSASESTTPDQSRRSSSPARDGYSIPLRSLARHRGQRQIRCTSGSAFHPQCPDQQHLLRCIQGRFFQSSLCPP